MKRHVLMQVFILVFCAIGFAFGQAPQRTITRTATWNDNSTNETGFTLWKVNADGSFTEIGKVGANQTTYANITITAPEGSNHCFVVSAYNDAGDSKSLPACVTIPVQLPTAAVLSATIDSNKNVTLSWPDNADNETEYRVARNGTNIATLPAGSTTFTETVTGSAGTSYAYTVAAVNSAGINISNSVTVTISNTIPIAPSNFKLSAINSSTIDMSWRDNARDESGFRLRRSSMWKSTVPADIKLAADTSFYTDKNLRKNSTYCYCVEAYNNAGLSQGIDNCGCARTLK